MSALPLIGIAGILIDFAARMIDGSPGFLTCVAESLVDLAPGFIEPALRFVAGLLQIALQLLAALAGLLTGPVLILGGAPTEHGAECNGYS
jgi:hypothetical protein